MHFVDILNGPNLNLLGIREVEVYGAVSLAEIISDCRSQAQAAGISLNDFQSNHEGALIDRLHEIRGKTRGVVINPGGFSHTSVALKDAIACLDVPVVEVHLTNVFARDVQRHALVTAGAARGVICGLGPKGYELALEFILSRL